MSQDTKRKITQKDLVNALTLINDALDQLQNSDDSEKQEGADEVAVTDTGELVTLGFENKVKK